MKDGKVHEPSLKKLATEAADKLGIERFKPDGWTTREMQEEYFMQYHYLPELQGLADRGMLKIPVDKIGAVIGPGGKVIQKITADTGAEIEIEDVKQLIIFL